MAKAELGGVEVKKKRYLVMTVAAVLIMAAVAASAYVLQKNRETPEDRALRKSSEAASEETDSEASGNKTGEKISEKEGVGDNVLMSGAVKIELLSADVYTGDEITTEDKYPVEYFRSETLPEPESEEEITDWDALYEEAPGYKEFQESAGDAYTPEECEEITAQYQDVIDKHTQTVVKTNKLYFIKCRLTNTGDAVVKNVFPYDIVERIPDESEVSFVEGMVYFDKSVHTEGDDRASWYYLYRLEGHETMECTIGLVVPQEPENGVKYYYGQVITGYFTYNPADLPDFVDLDALPKPEADDKP